MAPVMFCKRKFQLASRECLHNRRLHPRRLQKRFVVVLWNLMNLRDDEQNLRSPKTMRIKLQVKGLLR